MKHAFQIYVAQLLLLYAWVRQTIVEVAWPALLLDPCWVRARQVPWEPLACLKDTKQRFPSAHGGTRWAHFPMRDASYRDGGCFCWVHGMNPNFLSLRLCWKPDLAGIGLRRVVHYDQFLLWVMHIPLSCRRFVPFY
jgi:hypothetical protein